MSKIDLEEYLASQKRFLRRFELNALRKQNEGSLPLEQEPVDWDHTLSNFIVLDFVRELSRDGDE